MHSRLLALGACAAALTAAGCGEQQIDVAKSAKLIQGAVEEQVGSDVKTIKCPDKVKVLAKASFTCAVTGRDGTTGTATVTQTDGKGTITVAAPFLPKDEAEQSIQAELRRRAPRATVVCPDIIVVKAGGKFVCKANLGEINATITARQTDATGSFTFDMKTY
ncbi:MAG: DUF4333 domain-containing protein [Solirubrobacteraceae bacterium]|nr:DUF4333 domain-containing protein [Solirubrobacteraceae bacterium]